MFLICKFSWYIKIWYSFRAANFRQSEYFLDALIGFFPLLQIFWIKHFWWTVNVIFWIYRLWCSSFKKLFSALLLTQQFRNGENTPVMKIDELDHDDGWPQETPTDRDTIRSLLWLSSESSNKEFLHPDSRLWLLWSEVEEEVTMWGWERVAVPLSDFILMASAIGQDSVIIRDQ